MGFNICTFSLSGGSQNIGPVELVEDDSPLVADSGGPEVLAGDSNDFIDDSNDFIEASSDCEVASGGCAAMAIVELDPNSLLACVALRAAANSLNRAVDDLRVCIMASPCVCASPTLTSTEVAVAAQAASSSNNHARCGDIRRDISFPVSKRNETVR